MLFQVSVSNVQTFSLIRLSAVAPLMPLSVRLCIVFKVTKIAALSVFATFNLSLIVLNALCLAFVMSVNMASIVIMDFA